MVTIFAKITNLDNTKKRKNSFNLPFYNTLGFKISKVKLFPLSFYLKIINIKKLKKKTVFE